MKNWQWKAKKKWWKRLCSPTMAKNCGGGGSEEKKKRVAKKRNWGEWRKSEGIGVAATSHGGLQSNLEIEMALQCFGCYWIQRRRLGNWWWLVTVKRIRITALQLLIGWRRILLLVLTEGVERITTVKNIKFHHSFFN